MTGRLSPDRWAVGQASVGRRCRGCGPRPTALFYLCIQAAVKGAPGVGDIWWEKKLCMKQLFKNVKLFYTCKCVSYSRCCLDGAG